MLSNQYIQIMLLSVRHCTDLEHCTVTAQLSGGLTPLPSSLPPPFSYTVLTLHTHAAVSAFQRRLTHCSNLRVTTACSQGSGTISLHHCRPVW